MLVQALLGLALLLRAGPAAALTDPSAAAVSRPDLTALCSAFSEPGAQLSTDFLGPLIYVTAGNDKIAYRRFQLGGPPDATPLVMLMGYGGTMSAWGPTLLHRLAQRREVIIFDPPAQGFSEEVVPNDGPLLPEMLEKSMLGFLSALNLTRPHVAGWSLGACAALKLAAHNPDRVGKVISWAGTSPDGRAVVGSLSVMSELFRAENQDEDYAAQNFDLGTPEGTRGACFWLTDKRRMPEDRAKPEVNLRYSKGILTALKPWNWASWRALKKTPSSVLLMGGLQDVIIPPLAQTKLAPQIPGAWMAQFPGGHGFLWQSLDRVLAVVEAFLMESPPAAQQAELAAAGPAAQQAELAAAGPAAAECVGVDGAEPCSESTEL